eukprot:1132574-Pleurochrysis_carterae.AAC.1
MRLNHDLPLFARPRGVAPKSLAERATDAVGNGWCPNQPTGLERDSARRGASSNGGRWPFKR